MVMFTCLKVSHLFYLEIVRKFLPSQYTKWQNCYKQRGKWWQLASGLSSRWFRAHVGHWKAQSLSCVKEECAGCSLRFGQIAVQANEEWIILPTPLSSLWAQ